MKNKKRRCDGVRMKKRLKSRKGMGTVEIVVIIAVLIGIALIFRDAIIDFVTDVLKSVFGDQSILHDINANTIRQKNRIN